VLVPDSKVPSYNEAKLKFLGKYVKWAHVVLAREEGVSVIRPKEEI
jgi:hypothetical protein